MLGAQVVDDQFVPVLFDPAMISAHPGVFETDRGAFRASDGDGQFADNHGGF